MSDKTKAALQGRQCHYQKLKQKQHTRPAAGGQSLSAPILGSAKLRRSMPISGSAQSTQILGGFQSAKIPFGRGYSPLPYTPEISRSFGRHPDIGYRCSDISARLNFAPTDFIQPFGSSLVRLRCSALSRFVASARIATKINFEGVSPSILTWSTNSITSCGTLKVTERDFEFTGPVGIHVSPIYWCKTLYTKKTLVEDLWCKTLGVSFVLHLALFKVKIAKPGSASTLTGPLTKPLTGVTTMASTKSTQTRPEFTWLFLATPRHYPECSPVVLRFDADTEETARAAFPGWELVFAAKIRAQAPCRVAFFDYGTRCGWAFDSASEMEVVGHG